MCVNLGTKKMIATNIKTTTTEATFDIVGYRVSAVDWIARFNGGPQLLAELHCGSIKNDLYFL